MGINDPHPLNGFDTELGHRAEPFSPQPVEEVPPQNNAAASNAASFLDQQTAPAVTPMQPAKPMWTMTIYSGGSPMEHQFELPETVAQPAAIPEVKAPTDAGNVLDLFKSALGPAKGPGQNQKNPSSQPGI